MCCCLPVNARASVRLSAFCHASSTITAQKWCTDTLCGGKGGMSWLYKHTGQLSNSLSTQAPVKFWEHIALKSAGCS